MSACNSSSMHGLLWQTEIKRVKFKQPYPTEM